MDQKMRLLAGPDLRFSVDVNNDGALSAGDPFEWDGSGEVKALTDGGEIAGVMVEDGAANSEDKSAQAVIDGQIWKITVSSQTLVKGVRVAAAGSGLWDGGASADPSPGWVVDADIGSSDTEGSIMIDKGEIS